MKFNIFKKIFFVYFSFTTWAFAGENTKNILFDFNNVCKKNEKWTLPSSGLDPKAISQFNEMLSKENYWLQPLSHALSLLKKAKSDDQIGFYKYYIGRAFFNAKLYKSAEKAFLEILTSAKDPYFAKAAATGCLIDLYSKIPALNFPDQSYDQLIRLTVTGAKKNLPIHWEALFKVFLDVISALNPDTELLKQILKNLKGSTYELAAQVIWSAYLKKDKDVLSYISQLDKYGDRIPAAIKQLKDGNTLFEARAFFNTQDYKKAAHVFKSIQIKSNVFLDAVIGQCWSELLAENYAEAIGLAIGSQAAWLKNAFIPETIMVAAIAFHEQCRYPEALKLVQYLRRRYNSALVFLNKRNELHDIYSTVIQVLNNNSKIKVPISVSREWLFSPVLISSQKSINALNIEGKQFAASSKTFSQEQKVWTDKLLSVLIKTNKRLESIIQNPQASLSEKKDIRNTIKEIKKEIEEYQDFIQLKPLLRSIYVNFNKDKPKWQNFWKKDIEQEIKSINDALSERINFVKDNIEALVAEIFDGASQDIVWRNAHPDALEKALPADNTPNSDETYNWGKSAWSLSHFGEVWEDELNALKANLSDNCNNKNKYLLVPIRK